MQSTINKNIELGRHELPAGSVTVSKSPWPECLVTTYGAGVLKSPKSSCSGNRKSKWSHNENKILPECYIRSITQLLRDYIKRTHQLWVEQEIRGLSSQRLAVQAWNIKSENIIARVERQEVLPHVSDYLLNKTPLQSSTARIGDTPDIEVEHNEINNRIAEHEVRTEEEVGVENEATRVTEAIVNVEKIL